MVEAVMTRREFLRELEGQLEVPQGSLHEGAVLSETEGWDSLAAVLFIALAGERVGVPVTGNQIANAKTIGDLLAVLGDKLVA